MIYLEGFSSFDEDVSDINEMFQDIIDEFGLEEVESEGLPYQEEPPQGLYYNWSMGKSNSRKTLALNVFCMGVVFRHKYLLMYPQLLEFVKRLRNIGYKVRLEKNDPTESSIFFMKVLL